MHIQHIYHVVSGGRNNAFHF